MAKFVRVENWVVVSIGQVADVRRFENDQEWIEQIVPIGCVMVSDAEYSGLQSDPIDLAIEVTVIERGLRAV